LISIAIDVIDYRFHRLITPGLNDLADRKLA